MERRMGSGGGQIAGADWLTGRLESLSSPKMNPSSKVHYSLKGVDLFYTTESGMMSAIAASSNTLPSCLR